MKKLWAFALLLLIQGCSTLPPVAVEEPKPNPPVVVIPPKPVEPSVPSAYLADWKNDAWSQMTAKALNELGKNLLATTPLDIDYYCNQASPKAAWARTDKIAFWVMQISALARFESGFKPEVTYKEAFNDARGQPVISRGLLQISQESANGYGCGITNAQMLHDPETNLRCGVRILNKWVVADKAMASSASPWKGAARYWSPFRKADRKEAMRLKTRLVCK